MSLTVAILTVSDSVVRGVREDLSGPRLRETCKERGWVVAASAVVDDTVNAISEQLRDWTDHETAMVLLTTGGTGISPRDVTPEATRQVIERDVPGIAELMRIQGLEQTSTAVLTRGIAGTRGRTLIVNLPGSPKGAVFSLGVIAHLLPHAVDLLHGKTAHPEEENGHPKPA